MNKIITGIIVGVVSGAIINFLFSESSNNNSSKIINNQQIITNSTNSNNTNNILQSNTQSVNINYNSNK